MHSVLEVLYVIGAEKKKDQLEEGYKLSPSGEIVPDYDNTIKYFKEGDVIKGTVIRIERDEVLVDVGYKSEGVIPQKELSIKPQNPKDICEVGEEIATLVMQKEDSEGRLILSKKRADYEKSWDDIEKASKENCTVKGTVIEIVRGGLILNIGVRSFLPASLIDLNRKKDLSQYMDQELECKVIEINRSRNNVVLSRKALLTDDRQSEKKEVLEKFEVGKKVKGKVSSIVDFGAFVDLGGIDGLIHISEISWEHINHPSEVLTIEQEVEVAILDIDKEKSRVSLGLKQTQDDPWKEKLKGFEIGNKIKGKVTKILPFGVFIEFNDNLEGLIHISELASKRVTNPKDVVEIGQELETELMGIDLSRRRISLSVKQLEKDKKVEDKQEAKTAEVAEKEEKPTE
ncbi:MAG: 30S ribosomal protein S1, partial [Actinobacteria bacterium]